MQAFGPRPVNPRRPAEAGWLRLRRGHGMSSDGRNRTADARWRQAAMSPPDAQRKSTIRTLLKCPEPACDERLHMAGSRHPQRPRLTPVQILRHRDEEPTLLKRTPSRRDRVLRPLPARHRPPRRPRAHENRVQQGPEDCAAVCSPHLGRPCYTSLQSQPTGREPAPVLEVGVPTSGDPTREQRGFRAPNRGLEGHDEEGVSREALPGNGANSRERAKKIPTG